MTTRTHAAPDAAAVAVGEAIHAAMWRRRVTATALGGAIGVSPSTMGKKLRGQVPITVVELLAIARLLDVDPAVLLGEAA